MYARYLFIDTLIDQSESQFSFKEEFKFMAKLKSNNNNNKNNMNEFIFIHKLGVSIFLQFPHEKRETHQLEQLKSLV